MLKLMLKMSYDPTDNIQSIDRIIIKALVFVVEDIIKIEPCAELLIDLEFCAGAEIRAF